MSKKDDRAISQKIADINALWDNEELFATNMPNREMYCTHRYWFNDDESCDCNADEQLIESIWLDSNTDWLAWELELME